MKNSLYGYDQARTFNMERHEILRKARKTAGLSLAEVKAALGLNTIAYLSDVERGKSPLSPMTEARMWALYLANDNNSRFEAQQSVEELKRIYDSKEQSHG